MKIFQISNNIVHYDMTHLYSSVAVARSKYPPTVQIVEAPDYVFEGWGFDPNEDGDARFIKPTPPAGWEYDDKTGTFYDPNFEMKQKIAQLKSELDSTDYKIIKCSEYQLAGLESPYDITELHTERQALRDEINQLETELAEAEAKLEGTSDGNN